MFLAFGWLRAGVEKAIDGDWWTGGSLRVFLAEHRESSLPFAEWLTGGPMVNLAPATAFVVLVLELVIGLGLLTGRRLRPALHAAMTLNVVFIALGVVSPSAFYMVLQLTLLLGLGSRNGAARPRRAAIAITAACAVAAVALLPSIRTIHPAEVIHDPAIMLVTIAGLVGASHLLELVSAGQRAALDRAEGAV